MKHKILLASFFVLTCLTATKAQINKGATFLGGSLWYTSTKTDYVAGSDYKMKSLYISPAVGKVVRDNLIVGVMLGYQKYDNEISQFESFTKRKQYGGGVFVRQYVPVIKKLYIFGEANVQYKAFREDATPMVSNTYKVITHTKGWDAILNVTPGLSFAITKNFHLETGFNNLLSASYLKRKTKSDDPAYRSTSNNFEGGIYLENETPFYLGFRFLLNNKG